MLDYRMTVRAEAVGGLNFRLRCLRDFDEAVDMMFAHLEDEGEGDRLLQLCPFFGKLWPAARALAAELARLGEAGLAGRRVLELGCGLALPSLVAARLGAVVTASDFHPDVQGFLGENLALNGVAGVRFAAADWRDAGAAAALGVGYDLVIGSDVLYDPAHAGAFSALAARCVAPGGIVLLTDPGRAYLQDFSTQMAEHGFDGGLRAATVQGDGAATVEVYVLEFRRLSS